MNGSSSIYDLQDVLVKCHMFDVIRFKFLSKQKSSEQQLSVELEHMQGRVETLANLHVSLARILSVKSSPVESPAEVQHEDVR